MCQSCPKTPRQERKTLEDFEKARPDSRPIEDLVFTPDAPPWNTAVAFGYWLLSLFAIFLCQAVFGVAFVASTGMTLKESVDDPTGILVQILAVLPAHLITLAVGWMIVTRMGRFSFGEMLGFKWGGFRWWHTILILLGIFASLAALTQIFGEKPNELERILNSSRAAVYAIAFMATFSAPIVEEVVYRGVMFSAFKRTFSTAGSVAMVTVLFTSVHLPQYWGDFATISALLTFSLVLTLVRAFTGNILPCILLHFIFNGLQTSFLVLRPWIEEIERAPS